MKRSFLGVLFLFIISLSASIASAQVTMEAEGMSLSGYEIEPNYTWRIKAIAYPATATESFSGPSGTYQVSFSVCLESDGQSTLAFYVGGVQQYSFLYPLGNDTACQLATITGPTVSIQNGQQVKIIGYKQGGSYARVDKLIFNPVNISSVSISPTSLNFGNQAVGTTSSTQYATITNSTNLALDLSKSWSVTGDFAFAGTGTCASSLAVGASCTISLHFMPTAGGTRTGSATIIFGYNGTYYSKTISLSGTGMVTTMTPTSINFGNITVGTSSSVLYVTVKNVGTTNVNLTGVLSGSSAFQFGGLGTCGGSALAPGSTCTVSLKFTPPATGTFTGTYTLTDSVDNVPQTVSLVGAGVTSTTSPSPTPTPTPSPTPAGLNYYVSTTGSDSNNGSYSSPWLTIQHAVASIPTSSQPITVHVAPGTYTIYVSGGNAIYSSHSGTASARIRYVSDVKWGAKIVNSGGYTAWWNDGSYVDIDGFDVSATSGFLGIVLNGSYSSVKNSHVHNIPGASTCTGNGGAGIDSTNYNGGYNDIIGNVVDHIGVRSLTSCRTVHGIYYSNAGGRIQNNISFYNQAFGIHLWHAPSRVVITNNLSFNNGAGGFVIGAGDAPYYGSVGADYIYVANNIAVYNNGWGIVEEGTTGSHNLYVDNLTYGNLYMSSGSIAVNYPASVSGTIVANPLFVNYISTGGGDYHLQSTSPAINHGTSTNAPLYDLDMYPRPYGGAFDIGPYEWH